MQGEISLSESRAALLSHSSSPSHPAHSGIIGSVTVSNPPLTLIGEIALHNQDDLVERLGSDLHSGASDATRQGELVLAAYRRWGEKCADYLLGEFAFAIWDDAGKSLFCCRDHVGARPFLYFQDRSGFIFASHPWDILDHPRVPLKLNTEKLALLNRARGSRVNPEDTFHRGVQSLSPGSWMVVQQGRVRRATYWRPEIRDNLVPRREEEVYDALRDLLQLAVQRRLARSERPSAMLSGGLDSSSVVSVAGHYLASRNRGLIALGGVVSEQVRTRIADEREYIDEFRGFPGVTLEYVTPEDRGPFDRIENPASFRDSFFRSSRLYLYEAMDAAAIASGSDLVFEGVSGEYGPTNWGVPWYAELALTGRWPTLTRNINAARRLGGRSPARELFGELRRAMVPRREQSSLVLLNREFMASASHLWEAIPPRPRWPDQRRHQVWELRGYLSRSSLRVELTGPGHLTHSYPLLDKRVLEFCISAPARYKVRNGYRRYLVRRALDGILPPRIQWRTTKGPFSPDYFRRYNAQLQRVRNFVREIGPRDPVRSIVDVDTLSRLVQRPPVDDGDSFALTEIPGTVYLICFLRQFPELRP